MSGDASEHELLIITNALAPYAVHNIVYLSMPSGLTYHFRYRKRYFHNPYGNDTSLDDWIHGLEGRSGLLVLRDHNHDTLIPLRKIRVHRLEDFGAFVFLDLEFLNYVKYQLVTSDGDGQAAARQLEREKYSDVIASLIPETMPKDPHGSFDKLVIAAEMSPAAYVDLDDESSLHSTMLCWYQMIQLLADLPAFQGICFLRVASLTSTELEHRRLYRLRKWLATITPMPAPRSSLQESLLPQELAGGRKGYRMIGGQTYSLKLLQTIPSSKDADALPFSIELQSSPQHILPMRDVEIVDGAYDRLEFLFHTIPQAIHKASSYIVLACKQCTRALPPGSADESDQDKTQEIAIPPLFVLIEIQWTFGIKLWRWVIPPVFGSLGVLLWLLAEPLTAPHTFLASLSIKSEYVRYVSLLLLAVAFQNWSTFTSVFKVPSASRP